MTTGNKMATITKAAFLAILLSAALRPEDAHSGALQAPGNQEASHSGALQAPEWSESWFAFSRPLSEPGWYPARAESLMGLWTCLECDGQGSSVLPSLAVYYAASLAFDRPGSSSSSPASSAGFILEAVRTAPAGNPSAVLALGWVTVDHEEWSGLRFSLFGNWSSARFTGVQWSTGLNYAADVVGLQIGLVNVAGNVKGLQVGLVNVSSSPDVVQIGLVNLRPRG